MLTNSLRSRLFLAAVAAFALTACDGDDGAVRDFDSLTLVAWGGMPFAPRAGNACDSSYRSTTTVDATTSTITWDTCGNDVALAHTVIRQGSRSLDPTELAAVRNAWASIPVGNRGMCGADKATITIDVVKGDTVGRYVEDFYGCQPPTDGRTFVGDTTQLLTLLWTLTEKPALAL